MPKRYYRYPKPKPIPDRPVDVVAGPGSVAGKLKKQRENLESGDETKMHPTVGGDNEADEVLKRGYFTEK